MACEYTLYGAPQRITTKEVLQIPNGAEVLTAEVAIAASNGQSPAFAAGVNIIVVTPTANCRVALGVNPVASNAGTKTRLLLANQSYTFSVIPGWKLGVIAE